MDAPVSAPLLEARHLRVAVPGRVLIDRFECGIRSGEFVALLGGNGAGKSLLLRTLAGLRAPAAGAVQLDGRDIQAFTRREIAARLGFLPQDPDATPQGLLEETVLLGRFAHLGFWEMAGAADTQRMTRHARGRGRHRQPPRTESRAAFRGSRLPADRRRRCRAGRLRGARHRPSRAALRAALCRGARGRTTFHGA
jgi:ABC-type sugar transport system ATPase subunit